MKSSPSRASSPSWVPQAQHSLWAQRSLQAQRSLRAQHLPQAQHLLRAPCSPPARHLPRAQRSWAPWSPARTRERHQPVPLSRQTKKPTPSDSFSLVLRVANVWQPRWVKDLAPHPPATGSRTLRFRRFGGRTFFATLGGSTPPAMARCSRAVARLARTSGAPGPPLTGQRTTRCIRLISRPLAMQMAPA